MAMLVITRGYPKKKGMGPADFHGKGGSLWLNHQARLVFHEFSHPESFLDSGKGWSIMIKKAFRFLITGSTWLADFKCWRLAKKTCRGGSSHPIVWMQLASVLLARLDGCKMLQQLPGVIYPNDQLLSGNQTWQWKIPICRSFTQLQTSILCGIFQLAAFDYQTVATG